MTTSIGTCNSCGADANQISPNTGKLLCDDCFDEITGEYVGMFDFIVKPIRRLFRR
jgi:hypothetical protein